MNDLRNTIAHILEHKQHLAKANEATIQQYVVLPILRALGWDDTNLASIEVLPEYAVTGGKVDYALKVGQKLALFLECKKWNESLDKHENQIVTYAVKAGMPIVGLTNGKIWRFYFSWIERTSVSDRIFCETDIEDRENAVVDLEKYLLKSKVASGEAELDAEIALEEKGKTNTTEISPIILNPNPVDDVTDNPSEKRPITVFVDPDGEWTIERVRNSLSQEVRNYYEKNFSEERCNVFYRTVAETQNLIQTEDWRLKPKFRKKSCRFWLTDKGVTQVKSVFGIHLQYNPFTLHARIMKRDAEELKHQYRCEFSSVIKDKSADYIYYHIPDDITELRPVLEFAYKKHIGTNLSDNP